MVVIPVVKASWRWRQQKEIAESVSFSKVANMLKLLKSKEIPSL
jgi:hypothetical protein